jgi:mannose-6-phosphate isomerase-like protein (cupin superfamily)
VNGIQTTGLRCFAHAARRVEGLRYRAEDPVGSVEKEDGARTARKTHGAVAGDAFEDRTSTALSDAADVAADCHGVSVGLDYFVATDRDKPVVGISRHRERLRFPEKAGGKDQAYEFESLGFPAVQRLLNSHFAEFFPVAAEKLRRHQHPGAEFIYVLSGTLTLHIGDEQHTLEARGSIYFDSTVPHAYRKSGARACCALVVTTG